MSLAYIQYLNTQFRYFSTECNSATTEFGFANPHAIFQIFYCNYKQSKQTWEPGFEK